MVKLLEEQRIFTALGLRFWDPVEDQQVGVGLRVAARAVSGSGPTVRAFRTISGIYAFRGLPGLRRIEEPSEEEVMASPPERHGYILEIADDQERFLPVVVTLQLPLGRRGLFFGSVESSPPGRRLPGFYLFSAPSRVTRSGVAVVRMELFDVVRGQAAAHALVELEIASQKWFGLGNENGAVAIFFPYPRSKLTLGTSPPSGPPLPLQHWPVKVRVRYQPGALRFPTGSALPDLRTIRDQADADIFGDQFASPGETVREQTSVLNFGQELVLRTGSLPQLWIASR